MANILLCEINRMKEIMGLSLLSEGIDDLVKKLLGVSDESAESIAKSADDVGSEFSTALKQIVGGAGTYDDLLSYVSKQGGSIKSVDNIVTFVKSQPELLKKIATSSDVIMKDAAQSIIQRSSVKTLLEKDLIENIEGIILYTVDESDAAIISKMIDDTLVILNRYSNNSDITDLIKKLKDKKSVVNNMKSEIPEVQVKTTTSFTPSSVASSFIENLAYGNKSFVQMTDGGPMSGWKIHIYGEDVSDSAYLITKLDDYLKSNNSAYKIATDNFYKSAKGTKQEGKGLTIYIPYDIVKNGKQKEFFDDIESKISDYTKSGTISGDKSYNSKIHYRYEYNQPFDALPEGGVTNSDVGKYYVDNQGDYMSGTGTVQPDLFGRIPTTDISQTASKEGTTVTYDMLKGNRISNKSFTDDKINWNSISNAKNLEDYNKLIAQAIQTGDYQYISRGGFENFGIDNFRDYLMNNISVVNELDPSIGRWSVNFK